MSAVIGVIGGTGLNAIEGLQDKSWERVLSPWGSSSDEMLIGTIDGTRHVFLPRHERGYRYAPSDINYRANIDAMKRLGVTDIISFSAVGSLRADLQPGQFVIVDQFVDLTHNRPTSFFGSGCVAHVSMAEPVCSRVGDALEQAAANIGMPLTRGGTYVAIEGPQFPTRAECDLYGSWGCSVVGMTNMPEAKLAREAEMCYSTVAVVTDYGCRPSSRAAIGADQMMKILTDNADRARALVRAVAPLLKGRPAACPAGCDHVLDHAIVTDEQVRDHDLVAKLDAVAGRVLRK